MKHALLFFALLLSVGAWALPVKKATFNFSRPQSLTPSYTESAFNTDAGASIKVSDVKFTSGDITLSFNDEQNATGDWLAKHTSSDQSIYYTLDMSDNSRMVVSGADVKILSSNGKLMAEGRSNGGTFTWNGCDRDGNRVASGVYMVVTATDDGKKGTVCKIAVIR